MIKTDFQKFATSKGINSLTLHDYNKFINGYISPTIIEERQMHVTQMDVFSKLIQERQIFLGTGIDADVANIINAQLLYLDSVGTDDDITILVNTPGGSVIDGLSIYDTMNYIVSDVSTITVGMAASMGSIIASSGTKGKRFILPHSRFLLHQPLGGCKGQASDIEIEYKEIQYMKEELYKILAENTEQSFDKIYKDADRDFWLTADESVNYGLVDSIIKKRK